MVIRAVDDVLPDSIRNLYSSLRLFVDRSGFPQVFGALQPTRIVDVPPADPALLHSAGGGAGRGLGAQGAVGGAVVRPRASRAPAFVYAPQRVLTNAHVVAGANQVQVRDRRRRR